MFDCVGVCDGEAAGSAGQHAKARAIELERSLGVESVVSQHTGNKAQFPVGNASHEVPRMHDVVRHAGFEAFERGRVETVDSDAGAGGEIHNDAEIGGNGLAGGWVMISINGAWTFEGGAGCDALSADPIF